jgi:hypothetical protein
MIVVLMMKTEQQNEIISSFSINFVNKEKLRVYLSILYSLFSIEINMKITDIPQEKYIIMILAIFLCSGIKEQKFNLFYY